MGKDWGDLLADEMNKVYMKSLWRRLSQERIKGNDIYPMKEDIFNAYKLTQPFDIKAVILGQDPYHTPGVAHGLCFSSLNHKTPPSLLNIFREIQDNFGFMQKYSILENFSSNNLECWAKQGVFLLNTILTVEKGKALSHQDMGWERFTRETLWIVSELPQIVVVMLWGKQAKEYKDIFEGKKNKVVLESHHPAAAIYDKTKWFGNKHFKKCNDLLKRGGVGHIDWTVEKKLFK